MKNKRQSENHSERRVKKNAGKMPAFQFYPGDWRADTGLQCLDYETRGIWIEILCLMHESEEGGALLINGRVMSLEVLARLLRLDVQTLNRHLDQLFAYGLARRRESDGAIYNKRMVADEKLIQIRRAAGKLGGNPLLLNQKAKQKPTPSSSLSFSASVSISSSKEYPLTPQGVNGGMMTWGLRLTTRWVLRLFHQPRPWPQNRPT